MTYLQLINELHLQPHEVMMECTHVILPISGLIPSQELQYKK